MTLSKDTLEAASPAARTASPSQSAPQPRGDAHLRADAVSLDVPVKVHGSRVTDVVRGVTPHTEPFEEETSTMIVFPQGGVLRMATNVAVGQMLVLTNLKSKQDAICRVVKVRAYSNTQAYVEVEFTHRQAGYWGVHFPEDEEEERARLMAQSSPEPAEKRKVDISSVSVKVESIPKPPAPPARPESSFVSIGSQEEVQVSASSTAASPRVIPQPMQAAPAVPAYVPPPVRVQPPAPVQAAPHAPVHVDPPSISEEPEEQVEESPRPSRSFGSLTGGSATAANVRVPNFGARLDEPSSAPERTVSSRSGNGMWIAACAAFLVVGVAGGAWYFRQHPAVPAPEVAKLSESSQQPALQQTSAPVASAQPAQVLPPAVQAPAQPVAAVVSEPVVNTPRPSRSVAQPPAAAPVETQPRAANPAPAREVKSAPGINLGAIAAHPVAKSGASAADAAAPSIGAPTADGVLPEGLGSGTALAPPPPGTPTRVGGLLIPPKLIHTVTPIYPPAARQTGASGNVVIAAQIDNAGNVTGMKVVSGSQVLQNAALTAVKNWKYQPATLDGNAISQQVLVTIHFNEQ